VAAPAARRGLRRGAPPLNGGSVILVPRIVVTTGEPAGVGPDLALLAAGRDWPGELVFAGDPALLAERAALLGLTPVIRSWSPDQSAAPHRAGQMPLLPIPLRRAVEPGRPDTANAGYVLELLDAAVDGCSTGRFAAVVTAPVHKATIAAAGHAFTGHTEYLAARTRSPPPVMLLVAGSLRVALATTHLPLAAVPARITAAGLRHTLAVLAAGLRSAFGLAAPRILVCGLNPHAGEAGHLGREELEIIGPAVAAAVAAGIAAHGPVPADTAFTPAALASADAVLAMYHDQGLPVIKHAGFGRCVNVTLGLPILRTSVDHGTALDLAGTGRADPGSLFEAIGLALRLARR